MTTPGSTLSGRPTRSSDETESLQPTVLIIGGFLTSPPFYWPLARRLRDMGASAVVIAPIWTPDWLLLPARGPGPILTRAGRGIIKAGERSAVSRASRGTPLLVVGHSAGGIVARLLTSPEPLAGRRLGAAARVAAIVTLGTPHNVAPSAVTGREIQAISNAFADRVVPGAFHSPSIGYVSVASIATQGRAHGSARERVASRLYASLLGPSASTMAGDGQVPLASAILSGSVEVVEERAVHGQLGGAPWYGSQQHVDHWWPVAVEAWRGALRARGV